MYRAAKKVYKPFDNPALDTTLYPNTVYSSHLNQNQNQNRTEQTGKMFKYLALSVATLTTLAMAGENMVGNAIVHNKCPYDVYLWSVGSAIGPKQVLAAGEGKYSEPFHRDDVSGGIALKITRTPNGLYDSSPQLSFAYALDAPQEGVEQKVWWDPSNVFGNPFKGEVVTVKPSCEQGGACEQICWPDGVAPQGGSQVKNCPATDDVEMTLCAHGC